ncbi:MAG: hypothetical protein AB9897_07870 [Anaerolineaceae bacterium]
MNLKFPHIDLISFWIGFILATILWVILQRISKLLPVLRKSIAANRLQQQQKKDLDREHGMLLFALRKAQTSHIASSLFPLEDILVEPSVITSARFLPKTEDEFDSNGMYKILPDIPEVPQLLTGFPILKNSLFSILQAGQQYIAISSEPGFGKTTALAALASRLCLEKPSKDKTGYLPVFFDYVDLELSGKPTEELLINYLIKNIKGASYTTIDELLHHADGNHRLVFLVDGLDRLPIDELGKAVQCINNLKQQFPLASFVVACDPFITGDLESSGFEVFALSAWGIEEKRRLLVKWKNAWFTTFTKETNKQKLDKIFSWLLQENLPDSPLELTIRVWSAVSGCAEKGTSQELFASWLRLISGGYLSLSTAEVLAQSATITPYPSIAYEKVLEIIEEGSVQIGNSNLPSSSSQGENQLPSHQVVDLLVKNQFFKPISENQILFTSFPLFSFLFTKKHSELYIPDFSEITKSPINRTLFEAQQNSQSSFQEITTYLGKADGLLRRDHFFLLSWLKRTDKNDPLREKIFRQTAALLQDISLPIGLRFRFIYALSETHDPTISSLFSYFSSSFDDSIRQISALGLGIINDEKSVSILLKLSKDNSLEVQKIACISLNKIWSQPAQAGLLEVVFNAEEEIRYLACELISKHHPEGDQILEELAATDNYLARKAAIFGLVHIQQPWVNVLLEKLSIEDTQWVVRDAAKFALEHPRFVTTYLPERTIPILENPWILQKSESYSISLPEKGFPSELLYRILQEDTLSNKNLALSYLLSQPTPLLIKTLTKIASNPQSDFREEALNGLYKLSKRGLNLDV